MSAGRITVVPYDEEWEDDYLIIRDVILECLNGLAAGIEHVGSTSVKRLSAKPIIDIDVVIKDNTDLETVISSLAKAGYVYEGDLGITGREAFAYQGEKELPEHHLYVCPEDSQELRRHIAFRDYLRSHPEAVQEYSRIKEDGARLYGDDIGKYTEHKTSFIKDIYSELGLI